MTEEKFKKRFPGVFVIVHELRNVASLLMAISRLIPRRTLICVTGVLKGLVSAPLSQRQMWLLRSRLSRLPHALQMEGRTLELRERLTLPIELPCR